MGLGNFFDNFIGGLTLGMLAGSAYSSGFGFPCLMMGFGMTSSASNLIFDNSYQNSFPKIDFSGIQSSIWEHTKKNLPKEPEISNFTFPKFDTTVQPPITNNIVLPQYEPSIQIPQYSMPFSQYYFPEMTMPFSPMPMLFNSGYTNPFLYPMQRDILPEVEEKPASPKPQSTSAEASKPGEQKPQKAEEKFDRNQIPENKSSSAKKAST